MGDSSKLFGRNILTFQNPVFPLSGTGRSIVKEHTPAIVAAAPPKISLFEILKAWTILVLAVSHLTKVAHYDMVHRSGRPSRREAEAKRLLCAAFLEVVGAEEGELAIAWLEQSLQLGRRSVVDSLRELQDPAALAEVLQVYSRLMRELGPDEVKELVAAGLFGERRSRATVWPKGFLKKLGLE